MPHALLKNILLLTAAHAVTDLPQGALLVALPFLKAKFALTYTQTSLIILVQSFTSSISQPVFGYVSDKRACPWMMPVGCVLSGSGMLASLFAPSYGLLLAFTFLSGLGVAMFHPEAAKTAHQFSGASHGRGVSLFVVGGTAGMALGSLLLGILLAGGAGWQLLLYVLPSLIIAWPLFHLAGRLPAGQLGKKSGASLSAQVLSSSLLALFLTILIRSLVSSGLSTFIPLYFVAYHADSTLLSGSVLTLYLAAGAIGTLAGGILSDRYGSRKVMMVSIAPVALIVYGFQAIAGLGSYVLLTLASAMLSAAHASGLVLAQRLMPGNVGMASGLILGFSFGVGALGVLALGKVADLASLPTVFDILAVLPLLGLVCTFFVRDSAGPRTAK